MPNALPLPLALLAGKESPGANVSSEFAKLGLGQTPPGARSPRAHNRGDGNQRDDRRRRIGNAPVTALRRPSRLDHVIARRHKRRAHDRSRSGPQVGRWLLLATYARAHTAASARFRSLPRQTTDRHSVAHAGRSDSAAAGLLVAWRRQGSADRPGHAGVAARSPSYGGAPVVGGHRQDRLPVAVGISDAAPQSRR
jgi:hypothetical protein